MIKCPVCKKGHLDQTDNEFICDSCGASLFLKLEGFYKEGEEERIECGKEFQDWLLDKPLSKYERLDLTM